MKKLALILMLAIPLGTVGCKPATTTTTPQTLAPGYTSQADQTMGEILAGAHAFYNSIQQQTTAGQMTLTATEKTAFNAFGVSLNAAESVYLAYHSNPTTANQTAAQNAVNQVQAQQAALPQPGATK